MSVATTSHVTEIPAGPPQAAFDAGHIAGATHMYHATITEEALEAYPPERLFG